MKANSVAIKWTSKSTKEPVAMYSLDFHQSGLLATAACDGEIQLWLIQKTNDNFFVKHLGAIGKGHTKTNINCIRFSPCGHKLVSGADYGELYIWTLKPFAKDIENLSWSKNSVRGEHGADIMDLCWSNDGSSVATASVDNHVFIYDIVSGNLIKSFCEHTNFVQGVSWDPLGTFIVSQSADRSCRLYGPRFGEKCFHTNVIETAKNMVTLQTLCSKKLVCPETTFRNDERTHSLRRLLSDRHMFCDEYGPMFRRLSWSPDGSFLAIPSGIYEPNLNPFVNLEYSSTYLFCRKDLSRPLGQLPAISTPTSIVKWCPILFKNRREDWLSTAYTSSLPYRMYLAVANSDSLFVYDTESMQCVVFVGGLHLASITDIAWSPDGNMIATSSRDGFCSIISFEEGELGEPLSIEEIPSSVARFITYTPSFKSRFPPAPDLVKQAAKHIISNDTKKI